jgi:hypothetical protein
MFEIMLSLREETKRIEKLFVLNYNKAKKMADFQLWLVGAFMIVIGVAAIYFVQNYNEAKKLADLQQSEVPPYPNQRIKIALWFLLYILMLYIPKIYFDPRLANTPEFDEVRNVLDENALFENTCLG